MKSSLNLLNFISPSLNSGLSGNLRPIKRGSYSEDNSVLDIL